MKICPPQPTLPTPPGPTAGWQWGNSAFGTSIRKRTPPSLTGLKGWCKPSPLLGGLTLWDVRKAQLAKICEVWNSGFAAVLGYTDAAGAANPFTNIDGTKTTHNGFELYMHNSQINWLCAYYPNFGWAYHGIGPGGQHFDSYITEADQPTPAIVDAHLYTDWTYSITLSNWEGSYIQLDGAPIYVTPPGTTTRSGRHIIQVDTADFGSDLNHWTDGGRGVAASLMKPFPLGASVLLGIRSCTSPAFSGILPSPIAMELVEVEAP
jgi:hypothetical protein